MTGSIRQVSVFICDDLLVSMNGKWTATGIYTSDIAISGEAQIVPQMVFLFAAETPIDDPWQSLAFEVLLPGEKAPTRLDVPVPSLFPGQAPPEGRTTLSIRSPILISQPILRPGRIKACAIDERGEILLSVPWIITLPQKAST